MRRLKAFSVLLAGATVIAVTSTVNAGMMTIELDHEFSGATAPASATTPWVTATFDDGGSAGTVTLTIAAVNLTGSEKIGEFYFNFNPSKSLTGLTISQNALPAGQPVGTILTPTLDKYKADGDGLYDFKVTFPGGPPAATFSDNKLAVFTISQTGLLYSDFKFESKPDGGHGPFYAAAHIQSIGPTGALSGWIAPTFPPVDINQEPVPEPSSIVLLGIGGLGLFGWRRRKAQPGA
jgi:hypothetical protein